MKRILYTRPDGGVSIVIPCIGRTDPVGFTEEQALQRAMKDVPAGAPHEVVDVSEIPSDRTFRDAWKRGQSKKIDVDMPKARDIHRNRLRLARKPHLEALDVQFMRGLEATGTIDRGIVSQKQALRDITDDPRIEAAATPEELKVLTFEALTGIMELPTLEAIA